MSPIIANVWCLNVFKKCLHGTAWHCTAWNLATTPCKPKIPPLQAYLESHNVAESQKCHIPWTEEVPNVPLQARRLQEMTPSGGSTSWWAAFAAVSALGSLVTARVVTRNEMNAEAPTDPMA